MSDLPKHCEIHEEGPREGFQIEPGPISTADKVKLIDALSETGLHHIQVCSFVNPRLVPGWADASARHHERILAALEQRDAHEAQRVMEHHIAEGGELAVEILQEMGYWDANAGDGVRGSGAA